MTRADGWTVGYRIVAERTVDGVAPWVTDTEWRGMAEAVIYP